VRKALAQLQQERDSSSSTAVTWINCMSVTTAGEVFAQIADAATRSSSCSSSNRSGNRLRHLDGPDSDDEDAQDEPFPAANSQLQPIAYKQLLECLRAAGPQPGGNGTSSRPAPKSYRAGRQATKAASNTSGTITPAAGSTEPSKGTKRSSSGSSKANGDAPASASASPSSLPQQQQQQQLHIVVLDEIDSIAKRSVAELVRFFLLPHEPGVALLLVGIANCIDLTERALPQLRLQLATPRLITFPAYSAAQLARILEGAAAQLPCK
jgi:Cdc6-like AAA superfamily ATPase